MNTKVLISGGTGLIGKNLTKRLEAKGYHVAWLSRRTSSAHETYTWNPERGKIDPEALKDAGIIINLAGAGVADHRWSAAYKQLILESRLQATQTLVKALNEQTHGVHTFIQASAVGYYGMQITQPATEDTPAGEGFLAEVCHRWEAETQAIPASIRQATVRIGLVLTPEGGYLKEFLPLAKLGLAASLGDGRNILPWIHLNDLVELFIFLAENPHISGAFNGVAPNPVSGNELNKALTSVLKKPYWLPGIPAPLLNIITGEMATMLLASQPVSAEKTKASGFKFSFPEIQPALHDLVAQRN